MHCDSQSWCTRLKVVLPSRHVPICPFRHLCCRTYCLVTKRTAKNESKKTRAWVSPDRRPRVCWFIAHCWEELIRCRGLSSARLSGLSARVHKRKAGRPSCQRDPILPFDRDRYHAVVFSRSYCCMQDDRLSEQQLSFWLKYLLSILKLFCNFDSMALYSLYTVLMCC